MRKHAVFVEKSAYTIDLISNVHNSIGFEYSFLKCSSFAKSEFNIEAFVFEDANLFLQIKYLLRILRLNDLIVFNGYNDWRFVFLFILNTIYYKKFLAIESDTPLYIKTRGQLIKRLYLSTIFRNKKVLGLAGGNFKHKDLFRYYGMDESRIFLAPMMVNNFLFETSKNKKTTPLNFLFVGRMIEIKGLDYFLRAVKQINPTLAKFTLIGGGDLKDSLITNYACDNIHFSGPYFNSELIELYRSSDVLFLPSLKESWGLVVNEALAAGLPVLCSKNVGCIDDLIVNNKTGFIFDPYDSDSILNAVMKFIDMNEMDYLNMSNNCNLFMKKHWNYSLYKDQYDIMIRYIGKSKIQ